jgi:HAMP domain-containing protein
VIYALVAIGLVVATALVTTAAHRRALRELAETTHKIVRDPKHRVQVLSARGDVRELGRWINALADARRSRATARCSRRSPTASPRA